MSVDVVRDAPSVQHPPVDPNVVMPEAVRRAAAVAEQHYAKDPNAAPAPAKGAVAQPQQQAPHLQSQQQPTQAPVDDEQSYEHKFRSQQGRITALNNEVRQTKQQLHEMAQELSQTHNYLKHVQQAQNAPAPARYVSDEEQQAYGEFVDVAKKASLEVLHPEIQALRNELTSIKQETHNQKVNNIYTELARSLPNWQQINQHPDFSRWLDLKDPISGAIRRVLLNSAFQAANAARVVAIFNGFVAENAAMRPASQAPQLTAPGQPAPTRQPAVSLETLAAPGRARSAPGSPAAEKPVYSRADIDAFYRDVRRGVYAGRDNEKLAKEIDIYAAQREGRVQ